ncbi:amino acid permease [Patescibacteria group bacterium]|nr:amino acid permease [Patescibacteria group bacterium]
MAGKTNIFQPLSVLVGTIIGVGLFSLPYITVRAGVWTMLGYFLLLGGVTILIKLIYGEVILRTREIHRLPGYVGKYLGAKWKKISFFSNAFGLTGALLAYLIVGGNFLYSLFSQYFGGSKTFYTLILFAVGACLIYFGIKSISYIESLALILFFVVLFLIFQKGFSLVRIENFFYFDLKHFFLPYGAILFSLSGTSLIPEVREMLRNRPQDLKKVIFWAIAIAVLVYLSFIFIIVGITGQNATPDAIIGLRNILNDGLVGLALVFGFLTVFTSLLTIGLTLKKILWYDMGLKENLSWFLACFTPLVLFFAGFNNFITVISLVGGVFLGVDVTLMILIYLKAKKQGDLKPAYSLNLPRPLIYSLILFFILGAVYEIYYFLA